MPRDEELGFQGRASRARKAAVGHALKDARDWHRQATVDLEAENLPSDEHAAAAKALIIEFGNRQKRGGRNARARNSAGSVLMREIREEIRKEKEQ
jgi:hypothetical protein